MTQDKEKSFLHKVLFTPIGGPSKQAHMNSVAPTHQVKMPVYQRAKIIFTGSFGEYFISVVGLVLLSFITFGLALPYLVYWQLKYFVANLEIELYAPQQ